MMPRCRVCATPCDGPGTLMGTGLRSERFGTAINIRLRYCGSAACRAELDEMCREARQMRGLEGLYYLEIELLNPSVLVPPTEPTWRARQGVRWQRVKEKLT